MGHDMAEAPFPPNERRVTAFGPEAGSINLYAESALHAALKLHFAEPGDRLEVKVEGSIIDLVKRLPNMSAEAAFPYDAKALELVEIQTKGLGKIAAKVLSLSKGHRIRVVVPIALETKIARLDPLTGEFLSERKSPKRGDLYSLFDELIHAPSLIASPNVSIELALVLLREIKTKDGSGSWRKRGDRVVARELLEVVSTRRFRTRAEWLALLPRGLPTEFTSFELGEKLGIGAARARKILYAYAKAGLLIEAGKRGRMKAYTRSSTRRSRKAE